MGYLRHHEIEERENEKRVLENTLKSREVQERGNLLGRRVAGQAPLQGPQERHVTAPDEPERSGPERL